MKTAINMCMAVALAAVVAGCSMDSVQLGEYVKKEMQAELVKTDGLKALKMVRQAKLGRTSKLKGICSAKKTTCR